MKLKFLKTISLSLLLSASCFVNLANAGLITQLFDTDVNITNLAQATNTILGTHGTVTELMAVTDVINFWDGSGGEGHFNPSLSFLGNTKQTFVVNVTGFVEILTDGMYTFGTNADDGLKLDIDGISVIYDDSMHPAHDRFGSLFLSAGMHSLDLVFWENEGGASLELFATSGQRGSFDNSFRLVGDTQNGGLATSVPEPTTLAIFALGMIGLASRRFKKQS